jgi:hypothetical protein
MKQFPSMARTFRRATKITGMLAAALMVFGIWAMGWSARAYLQSSATNKAFNISSPRALAQVSSHPAWVAVLGSRNLQVQAAPVAVAATPELAKTTQAPPDYALVATMASSPESGRAFLRQGATGKLLTVRTGASLGRFTVKNIRAGTVVLEADGTQYELKVTRSPS